MTWYCGLGMMLGVAGPVTQRRSWLGLSAPLHSKILRTSRCVGLPCRMAKHAAYFGCKWPASVGPGLADRRCATTLDSGLCCCC